MKFCAFFQTQELSDSIRWQYFCQIMRENVDFVDEKPKLREK